MARSNAAAVRMAAQKAKVRIHCRTALPPHCAMTAHAERARALLGQALRAAEALGASTLGGALLYTPGDMGPTLAPSDGALLVEVLADLAHEAATRGISLLLEPAHRFESHIVNTVAHAAALVHAVGADNLGLGLSTLQLHIGEASMAEALRQAGPLLQSIRAAENTGGPIGSGAVQWDDLWRGLAAVQFDGLIILDAPRLFPEDDGVSSTVQQNRMAAATDLYPEEFAAQGLLFLQQGIAATSSPATSSPATAEAAPARRSAAAPIKESPPSPASTATVQAKKSPRKRAAPKPSGAKSYRTS